MDVWTVAELQIRKYMEGSDRGLIDVVPPYFPTAAENPLVKNADKPDKKIRNGKGQNTNLERCNFTNLISANIYFCVFNYNTMLYRLTGAGGDSVGGGTALQAGRSRVRMLSLGFFIDLILPATLWSWGRLTL